MIALDTNVLVRLLTRDDEAQARRAREAFDACSDKPGALFVADVVLAELCWTLSRSYGLARADIARSVRALLDNATLALESPAAVRAALERFEEDAADFPDCLIVAKAVAAGCKRVLSFDRRMAGLPGVEIL
ncbi:MAG: type II toxin-antitoxin system VapC family toxin [Pseudomonadota bacterium]|jgi:predicted nucleic-acid-binding protein